MSRIYPGDQAELRRSCTLASIAELHAAGDPPPLDPFTYALEGGRIQLIVGEGATHEGLAGARRFIDVLLAAVR